MRRLFTSGIFVVFCFLTVTILAQVPQLLNYQGRLTDDKGIPIITTTTVMFSLYQGGDATIEGSGTLCYRENASVIPDDNGVFSHLIGSGTVIYGALDATVFQIADPVYLEITIDPEGANETLLPRKQIVTVGYSFKSELADDADTVDGQDASAFAPVVHNHDPDYVNEGQADSVTSAMIADGTIVDADINASANISASKINTTGLDADLLDGQDSEDFVHTAGDDMTGTLTIDTSSTYAFYGTTTSTSGRGVYGTAPNFGVYGVATATTGISYGLYGESASTSGYGVYGYAAAASGSTVGVHGKNDSTNGQGVLGFASATSGTNYGVYGVSYSPSGKGVYGQAPTYGLYGETIGSVVSYGVYGRTNSTGGRGVYGGASAPSGTTYGVYGLSNSPSGYGVYGTAPTYGVYGVAATTGSGTNYGVYGTTASSSTQASGVYGQNTSTSGTTCGVNGTSNSTSGTGVLGIAAATSGANVGVYGITNSPNGAGVYGVAAATGSGSNYGVYGESKNNYFLSAGIYGKAPGIAIKGQSLGTSIGSIGVFGVTDDKGYGVFGFGGADAYAGYFDGKVHVTGDLTVLGSKPCVQPIDNGKKVLLYAMESPEIWFEDFGTAQLVNGQAVVPIEKVFAQTANTEIGYFVFPIPNGECNGLYIARKDKDSFEVRELGDGTSNISFDYRIVAKRRGYEEVRFEEFTEPEQPPAEQKLPNERKESNLK